ncbi:MAG: outer membrane beta-barrel protein [Bacteroidales bacterium]
MKKLFVLLFVLLMTIPAFSQVKFGIKAGAATATVPKYDLSTGTTNIEAMKDAAWGFHGGLFLRLTLLGVYIQPEAYLATNTYEYKVTTGTIEDIKKQTFNRLDIPVLVGFKLGPLRLNAGPAAAIQIGTPKALIDDPDFEEMYRGATFGYQAGLGIDLFKKITLDARYEGSLSGKFGEAVTIGSQTFKLDQRQPSFVLSVGLIF